MADRPLFSSFLSPLISTIESRVLFSFYWHNRWPATLAGFSFEDFENERYHHIRGSALAHAKRRSPKEFDKLVEFYHRKGFTDGEIVRAMAQSPQLVSALKIGGQR